LIFTLERCDIYMVPSLIFVTRHKVNQLINFSNGLKYVKGEQWVMSRAWTQQIFLINHNFI